MRKICALVFVAVCSLMGRPLRASEAQVNFERVSTKQENEASVENVAIEDTFQEVKDEIKVERIKMEPGMFKTYESPETKKERNFKFYNNTFMYVSFRDQYVAKAGEVTTERMNVRSLYQEVVADYLKNAQE